MDNTEAGRLGGQKTRDKYGAEHFAEIGKRGGATTRERYKGKRRSGLPMQSNGSWFESLLNRNDDSKSDS